MSATKIGINFRATSGYVTDDADQTYYLGSAEGIVTRGGWTFGVSSGSFLTVDRTSSGPDVRLAGINYFANSTTVFTVTLPAAADYKFRLALGDQGSSHIENTVVFKDGSTPKLSIGPDDFGADEFFDATDVKRTSSTDWHNNNAQSAAFTFSGTTLNIEVASGPDYYMWAHVEVERQGGGSSPDMSFLFRADRQRAPRGRRVARSNRTRRQA